ncbi:homoserine kinase [Nesterenkonia aerolata]|uniref:Homoserine kinase n=1 Tax=Nesterenkonia aerolata TaxID=3074079 RepID=A0ABU2DSP1_9MICC|nr:homoserine kinase [Nesterenkonia sp. LY-0111]MDR8019508.1 homoserine kinase [Nesterenkonia sp. LY-0111]
MPSPAASQSSDEALAEVLAEPVSFRVTVPATSANLGPGYDCMGVALELFDVVDVSARPRAAAGRAQVKVEVHGEAADSLPRDETHLIVALVGRILREHGHRLPDLTLQAHNRIPHSRGLGSSAAAVACAVAIASHLIPGGLSSDEQLQIGSRIEGHPDNYVPALRGGAAVSWQQGDRFDTAPLMLDEQIRAVVSVPDFQQSTAAARGSLPKTVAHHVAAANSARAALLVHALTADPARLFDATEDRLHQEQRRAQFPASMALVDALRAAGHAAVISGAGPTVLVLAAGDEAADIAADQMRRCGGLAEERWMAMRLPISTAGVTVDPYPR